MFTCKFGPPISGLLAVETITLPLLYLATEMANRENATDNAVLSALIFMEIGAIVVMILQVKEFCIGTSAIPLSFLGVFLLNFIVSTLFVFGKFQISKYNFSHRFSSQYHIFWTIMETSILVLPGLVHFYQFWWHWISAHISIQANGSFLNFPLALPILGKFMFVTNEGSYFKS